jgi:hypothetical protein
MTRKCVSDAERGQLASRLNELFRRVDEGTTPFDSTMKSLQDIIEGKFSTNKTEKEDCPFPLWKTVKLGTGLKTADDFRRAFKKNNINIGGWGNDILGQSTFTTSDKETELNLVNVSVAELGFKNGATRKDIYYRAKELGLELCPAEVGPQLRLQYKDQPNGEWLLIGMEPISGSDGFLDVFDVGRDGGDLWLDGSGGRADGFWDGCGRWVFVRK